MMNFKYNIPFTKVVGSGNDFIVLDDMQGGLSPLGLDYSKLAVELCPRNTAVGADGILVLENSDKADLRMRIINPDGSEVTMCGNGARCSVLYASKKGMGDELTLETGAGILESAVSGDSVRLKMSDPKDIDMDLKIDIDDKSMDVYSIDTGVPHVVHMVDEIDSYSVKDIGKKIREHSQFVPGGTNVNFIGKKNEGILIRTYERGVEDETLACGTGTVASAVILGLLGEAASPVRIKTKSGEILTVYFKIVSGVVNEVYLEGLANIVYEGRV